MFPLATFPVFSAKNFVACYFAGFAANDVKGRQAAIRNEASCPWQQHKLNVKGWHTREHYSVQLWSPEKFSRRDCRSQELVQRTARTKHFEEQVARICHKNSTCSNQFEFVGQVEGTKFWSPVSLHLAQLKFVVKEKVAVYYIEHTRGQLTAEENRRFLFSRSLERTSNLFQRCIYFFENNKTIFTIVCTVLTRLQVN